MVGDEQLWDELEEVGEDKVRASLAANVYGKAGKKSTLVEEWLRRKDQGREDSLNREQTEIARDAATSARDAADAARDAADAALEAAWSAKDMAQTARNAATTARIALAVAAISIIVSIVVASFKP
jgi:CHASE3 domain sensor protein